MIIVDVYVIDKYKKKYAEELTNKYFGGMKSIGFDKNETIEYLKNLGGDK